ncbi:hypothetical protein TSUD_52440 [Trifolium subterraneum]|uniref:Uncharacterized protein n=1 Tax=Trifolium subterraneum TaxID=3900 RepID=A0A2Z6N0Q3_TRISU|nr:hypothetical protein TSUD_52440 [Trifolium subterraneum]
MKVSSEHMKLFHCGTLSAAVRLMKFQHSLFWITEACREDPTRPVGGKTLGSNEKCERAEMNFNKVENEVQNQEGDGKAIDVVQIATKSGNRVWWRGKIEVLKVENQNHVRNEKHKDADIHREQHVEFKAKREMEKKLKLYNVIELENYIGKSVYEMS